jgi:hypothetical protein
VVALFSINFQSLKHDKVIINVNTRIS